VQALRRYRGGAWERLGDTSNVDAKEIFEELVVTGAAFAVPVHGSGIGLRADRPVSPASVGKIQIALAVEDASALDGQQQRVLPARPRTAGPSGIALCVTTSACRHAIW
jgi:hypothetical protein